MPWRRNVAAGWKATTPMASSGMYDRSKAGVSLRVVGAGFVAFATSADVFVIAPLHRRGQNPDTRGDSREQHRGEHTPRRCQQRSADSS